MLGKIDKDNYTYDDYCRKIFVRKKIFFTIKIILLFIIWTPLVVYYFLPISKANIVQIDGNALNFNEEYIYSYTDLNPKKHIWNVDTNLLENKLKEHQYCNNANVSLTFSGVKITINEIKVVAKNNDSDPILYLSNGKEKTLSSISNNLDDPLSVESKFIKPYINHIPLINAKDFKSDSFYTVVNNLGKLESSFVDKIKEVKVNNDISKFVMVTLIINKEDLNLNQDLHINVDYRDIAKLANEEVIDKCVDKIKNNDTRYYNILLENDIQNKEIKVVPYNA